MPEPTAEEPRTIAHPWASMHDAERWREGVVMALYVSLVLLTALVALPSDYDTDHGDLGLLAIVWGTTIGLAITHWFAFVLAAASLNEGKPSTHERRLAGAQLLGAAVVAAVTSIPLLLAGRDWSLAAASFAPALIIGVAGYSVVHTGGRSRAAAVLGAMLIASIGFGVAGLKVALGGH